MPLISVSDFNVVSLTFFNEPASSSRCALAEPDDSSRFRANSSRNIFSCRSCARSNSLEPPEQFRIVRPAAAEQSENERRDPRAGEQSNQRIKQRVHPLRLPEGEAIFKVASAFGLKERRFATAVSVGRRFQIAAP